jgi:2-keto-3-deoxy-L-fuconate dehydrogenase
VENLSSEAFRLDGKIALVTGGASRIGAATCRELTRAGANSVIADINLPAAQSLVVELPNAKAVEMIDGGWSAA